MAEQQRHQTVNLTGFPLRRCKSYRAHTLPRIAGLSADVAQAAEHILGKNEVRSANLRIGSHYYLKLKIFIVMAAKKPFIKIQCSVCKTTNYFTKKSKATAEKKLELKKFCSTCKKHTLHKEGKK